MGDFEWPVRVYYEDTDAAGVVYYANYLKFLERARTEFLRALGFEQDTLREQGVQFVVRSLRIEYRRSAQFNQQLIASVQVARMRRASIEFTQQVRDATGVCCDAQVLVACVDAQRPRPRAVPPALLDALQARRTPGAARAYNAARVD